MDLLRTSKIKVIFSNLLLILTIPFLTSVAQAGLLAYYPFEGNLADPDAGSTVNRTEGQQNYINDGAKGQALSFTGDDLVVINNPFPQGTTPSSPSPFSLSVWIRKEVSIHDIINHLWLRMNRILTILP